MIVKNEVKVLPRLFRSLQDYIDYYVIVDTGSTDRTIALIQEEMAERGIEGEVHERDWVNFGVNRQQALELAVAAGKCEWLLFIDADEELGVSDPEFFHNLEKGTSYNIEKHHGSRRYGVPHLINVRSSSWRWEGPVHNYIKQLSGPRERPLRKDIWIVYHSGEGAKSQGVTSEQKYLRDAKLLEQHLKEHPNDPRSQFYLAQSYRDAGHLRRAYEAYRKRAATRGWEEENFVAQLNVGALAVQLEEPEEVVLRELLAAYNLRPTRAEPLWELARYFRNKKMYGKAYVFAKVGGQMPKPEDILFLSQDVYDWRLLDELGVAAYWVGQYSESRAACRSILGRIQEGVHVAEAHVSRIQENIRFCDSKLGRD